MPIHHLESICVFGASTVSPPALDLCWEHGVAVNYLSDQGHLRARLTGVADTSVLLRRVQFRAADDPAKCAAIARQIVAGKIQNARNSLLRAARETENAAERDRLTSVTDALADQLRSLGQTQVSGREGQLDEVRGTEGLASKAYFSVFGLWHTRSEIGLRVPGRAAGMGQPPPSAPPGRDRGRIESARATVYPRCSRGALVTGWARQSRSRRAWGPRAQRLCEGCARDEEDIGLRGAAEHVNALAGDPILSRGSEPRIVMRSQRIARC